MEKIKWLGKIIAIQPRTRVWRYIIHNRSHYHLGYNLLIKGEDSEFIVAISEKQQEKLNFKIGDLTQGTAWPKKHPKREVAEYYRAGALKVLERAPKKAIPMPPPWAISAPPLSVYEERGARMLAASKWKGKCKTYIWANKSAVEIQWCCEKDIKRYRFETFCYGPKSCMNYDMGKRRAVPYRDKGIFHDDGCLDEILTSHQSEHE